MISVLIEILVCKDLSSNIGGTLLMDAFFECHVFVGIGFASVQLTCS